jgi:hypothetical protein
LFADAVEALVAAVKKLKLVASDLPPHQSIATHGLPPLGTQVASGSSPIQSNGHAPAELRVQEFAPLRQNPLDPSRRSILWSIHEAGEMARWGSEGDIKELVARALNDVINAAGLAGLLKCCREPHFGCENADAWVVRERSGVPVGVVEVNGPGTSSYPNAPLRIKRGRST